MHLSPADKAGHRPFALEDFRDALARDDLAAEYEGTILPQVRDIARHMIRAVGAPPSGLAPRAGARLRRFGIDLLVDHTLRLWLIEVNFLKEGFALKYAPKGAAGDAKRAAVEELLHDEGALRKAVRYGSGEIPEGFEEVEL